MNKYRNFTYDEMKSKILDLKKEYMDLRFKVVVGHVANPLKKREIKRNIARLNTMINEYRLSNNDKE